MESLIKVRGKEYAVRTPTDIILRQLSILFTIPLETEEDVKRFDFPVQVIVPDLPIKGHLLNSDELMLIQTVGAVNLMEDSIGRIQAMVSATENKELAANARNKVEELKKALKKIGGNIYDVQLEVLVQALATESTTGDENSIAGDSTIDIPAVAMESPASAEINQLREQIAALQSQVQVEKPKPKATVG